MPLNVHQLSYTPSVTSLGKHNHASVLELENIGHFSGGDVNLDGVVNLNIRVGVTDGASVVCDSNRNFIGGDEDLVDTTKFVCGFLGILQAVQDETSLGIVQETESVIAFVHFDDVHESSGEIVIGADFAVNLDTTFHADLHALLVGQGVLKTFTENDTKGKALTLFVRTSGGFGGPNSNHFAQVPVLRGIETFQVLLWSAYPILH